MKYLFRADAAPHIGIGDLVSLIKLSTYLKGEFYFLIKNYKASKKLVESYNLNYEIVSENEIEYINNFIVKNEIDTAIFEITETSLMKYKDIKAKNLICVNFDGIVPDNFDFVINWNSNTQKYKQKSLVGYEYAIIDKRFFEVKKENPAEILIAFGGADEVDMTYKVVKFLLDRGVKNLNVIVGAGYKGKVFEIFTPKVNVLDMADEYKNAKIAITAGGLSSIEAVATKTPAILIANYSHQIKRCEFLEKQGVAKFLGYRRFDGILNYINGFEIKSFEIKTQKVVDEILKMGQ